MVTDLDRFLFHQGTHYASQQFMGAHFNKDKGETTFTVWAPHARKVSIALDANDWTGCGYELEKVPDSGLFTGIFNVDIGTVYKYLIEKGCSQ